MRLLFTFTLIFVAVTAFSQAPIKGDPAPELAFLNPEGKQIKLSKLKGHIVLIDFWASWCGPCRRANPQIVSLHEKYKDSKFKGAKSFKILSVSLDRNKQSWINAIKKDNLKWEEHMSDLKGWKSEAAKIYSVRSIPRSFLINEKGIVIGVNLKPKDINFELIKRLKG